MYCTLGRLQVKWVSIWEWVNYLLLVVSVILAGYDISTPISNNTVRTSDEVIIEGIVIQEVEKEVQTVFSSGDVSQVLRKTTKVLEDYQQEQTEVVLDNGEFLIGNKKIIADPVKIIPEQLLTAYNNAPEMEFDFRECAPIINVLWEFLVNENDVDPVLASAVIGHMAYEGKFGQKQGGDVTFDSIHDARNNLSSNKSTGYGIIQWTAQNRRNSLLKYYEEAYLEFEEFGDSESSWDITCMAAECACLYEEMKAYGMFEEFDSVKTGVSYNDIEYAVGLLSRKYIQYQDNQEDWDKSGSVYTLANSDSNGSNRLEYARLIYGFYVNDNGNGTA